MAYYNNTLHFKNSYYKMSETSFDRKAVLNDSEYQYGDIDGGKSAPWYFIGLLIGLGMNFFAFVFFYVFHKREHLKQVSSKI